MTASLQEFVAEMDAQRRTVTVFSDEPQPDLAERFATWNVDLRFERLPEGTTDAFVTIRQGEQFLGSVDAGVLADFFEPTLTLPGSDSGTSLAPFLDHLDETLFHGTTRRQLLATSREFEDRAWRVGSGRVVAGFQRPDALEAQRSVFRSLAEHGLDVRVYFGGDWPTATIPGVRMHAVRNDEIGRFWFVAFDGGPTAADGDVSQACLLLAEEIEPRSYRGFWTYDPDRVQALIAYVDETYS